MEEQILGFNAKLLSNVASGPVFVDFDLWQTLLDHLESRARSSAETDYSFKQLVVYVVIKAEGQYLTYRRTAKTTEERLRRKHSIGIGGHVNVGDSSQLSLFSREGRQEVVISAVHREISEEVTINASNVSAEPQLVGFIDDNSDDVGKVHFGTAWILQLREPVVMPRHEKGISSLSFKPLSELVDKMDQFENWSQLLIKFLAKTMEKKP